jgi:putative DNA primase/helicase
MNNTANPANNQDKKKPHSLTDRGNAFLILENYRDEIKYVKGIGWHMYDGQVWELVEEEVIDSFVIRKLPEIILRQNNKDKDFIAWAKNCQSLRAARSAVDTLRGFPEIKLSVDDLNKNPHLLNCLNGTINLVTSELIEHDKDEYITQKIKLNYNKNAASREWESFLSELTGEDQDYSLYLKKAFGYCLTGLTSEQAIFFFFGIGGTGKSLFMEALNHMMGSYSHTLSLKSLLRNPMGAGSIPNDIASLVGKRAVFFSEVQAGDKFDEGKLKDWSSGDKLSGRFLGKEFFDFNPVCKLILRGNQRPEINSNDSGTWRRLHVCPANNKPKAIDKNLLTKLKNEENQTAILAWAVEGARLYFEQGLALPKVIQDEVNEYKEGEDGFGRFVKDCLVEVRGLDIKTSRLKDCYDAWADDKGMRRLSYNALSVQCRDAGFDRTRRGDGVFFLNLDFSKLGFTYLGEQKSLPDDDEEDAFPEGSDPSKWG